MHEDVQVLAASCMNASLQLAETLRALYRPTCGLSTAMPPALALHCRHARQHAHEPKQDGGAGAQSALGGRECTGGSASVHAQCHPPAQLPSRPSPKTSRARAHNDCRESLRNSQWANKPSRAAVSAKQMAHRALQRQLAAVAVPAGKARVSARAQSAAVTPGRPHRASSPAVKVTESIRAAQRAERDATRRHSVVTILEQPQRASSRQGGHWNLQGLTKKVFSTPHELGGVRGGADEAFGRLSQFESMLRSRAARPSRATLSGTDQHEEVQET